MADPNIKVYNAFDFFVYEVDFSALAAGASATGQFSVQAEADFLLTKTAYFADIAAAAETVSSQVIPLVTVMINDTGSGRNLMSTAVPVGSMFGRGDLPFILPRQRLFVASSVVNITVTNFSAATAYNLKLSFIGEKAFKFGR